MPLVSMRQLLDHAAEHSYGLPAFNVNNLEQVQAIMEAAAECDAPGDHAGLGRRAQIRRRSLPAPPHRRRGRGLSAHPGGHAPGPRPVAGGLHGRDPLGLLERDDGRLAAGRRQDALVLRVQRRRHPRGGEVRARDRRQRRGRARLPRLARDRPGRRGRRRRRRGHAGSQPDAHRPRPGRRLRQADRLRRARDRDRHQPRRLQVHPQAHRRHPRDRACQGHSRPHPQHPPGHARLLLGAAGAASRSSASTAAT